MSDHKMNFNATWSMAVGGMVGGGIFSVLGVIIAFAAQWAWLSFLIAGIMALISAYSYSQLALKFDKGGGIFLFLRKIKHQKLAGSLAWILILGYILTLAVYAFTFGHYVAHVFNMGGWLSRVLAVAVMVLLTLVNLKGVGSTSSVEIITVYGKLVVLIGLAIFGIFHWAPHQLTAGISPKPWHSSLLGAGTIFMAYEGFQLLSYDYDDIKNPRKTLPSATLWAVVAVILIYILVTFGTTMIVGAQTLIEQKEVALAVAGKKAMGTFGLVLVTIAAAFSTGSAINATLFSTARLMENVADKKDLPQLFAKRNKAHIPQYSLLLIATAAGILATIGSLGNLVDAASLIFLFTFGAVNCIAFQQKVKRKWICFAGFIACIFAIVADLVEQIRNKPYAIGALLLISIGIVVIRPYISKKMA